jgi:hypothetical protein
MPQYSDDLFLGPAFGPWLNGQQGQTPSPFAFGVGPLGRVFIFDVVPAALATNNICASQTVGAGANALINGARASGGVATIDVARCLQMAAAVGNVSNVTVFGTDIWGQPQAETRALNGTTPVNFLKAFRTVTRVLSAGAITTFTLGTRDAIGLPWRVTDAGYIVSVKWNNTLAQDAGTFTAAVTTNPNTAALGDVRGTYLPSNAADGVKRLVMAIALPGIAVGPNATSIGAIGVPPATS